MKDIGRILVVVGILILTAGILLWFCGDKFGWFGNLSGDIHIKKERFSFYFPFATMVLLSACGSVLIWLISKYII